MKGILQALLSLLLLGAVFYYLVSTGDSIGDAIFKLLFGFVFMCFLMRWYTGYLKREEARKKKREEERRS